jgi:hypothetical protein
VGAGVVVIVARRKEVVGHGFVVGNCVASISDIVYGLGEENGGNGGNRECGNEAHERDCPHS